MAEKRPGGGDPGPDPVAKPIQQRHVQNTHGCLLRLAAEEDPTDEA
jgi:hypothetical protein